MQAVYKTYYVRHFSMRVLALDITQCLCVLYGLFCFLFLFFVIVLSTSVINILIQSKINHSRLKCAVSDLMPEGADYLNCDKFKKNDE